MGFKVITKNSGNVSEVVKPTALTLPGFKNSTPGEEEIMSNDQAVAVITSTEIRALVPRTSRKSVALVQGMKLSRAQLQEVAVVCEDRRITPYTTLRLMKAGIKPTEVLELVEMHAHFGHFASYTQMAYLYRIFNNDVESIEHFLSEAEDFALDGKMPAKRFAFLLNVMRKCLGDDVSFVLGILQKDPREAMRELSLIGGTR